MLNRWLTLGVLLFLSLMFVLTGSALAEEAKLSSQWQRVTDEETGTEYYALDAVYVEKPVLESAQRMIIYAPAAYMSENADGSVTVNPEGAVTSFTGLVYTAEMLEIMSPINYIVGKDGYEGDIAPFWRLRIGSRDGDHGVPAAWLIAHGLEAYQPEAQVSIGIAWNSPHSLSELTEQDLYDYIAGIAKQIQ